ncbi:unnamed protein product [Mytilus edulis]|uniref:Uncharacterized protein n=1 Tax=Mytilus edulis TaxID=6550 RepID=A0A8S3SCW1_MYTED|nr:unnamed protein product [Mytilus edulis]
MLTSILQLFENEVITAIIQSIGIIYIKITAPYLSLASQNKPALEMATTYNTSVDELEKIVTNPALLLDTEYIMCPGHPSEISTFNMAVLKPLVAYSTIIECLGKMALSILIDVKKQQDNGLARGKNEEDKIMIMAQERKDSEILREKSIADDIKLEQERRDTIKGRIKEKEAKIEKNHKNI